MTRTRTARTHFMQPAEAASFAATLALAVMVSSGVLLERMSQGSARVGLVANLAATCGALVLLAAEGARERARRTWLLQAVAAVTGIAAVHVALRTGLFAAPGWLVERPAQLVNDAVAVLGLVLVVRACAGGLDLRFLALALGLVTLYAFTGSHWHLDAAPHGFAMTVQQMVPAEVAAVALALPVFGALRSAWT